MYDSTYKYWKNIFISLTNRAQGWPDFKIKAIKIFMDCFGKDFEADITLKKTKELITELKSCRCYLEYSNNFKNLNDLEKMVDLMRDASRLINSTHVACYEPGLVDSWNQILSSGFLFYEKGDNDDGSIFMD